ncbi:MAG TPA: glycosyltransferase family 9 protein [bacterium]|nr:glycosyltransferase family 9 protein [bacterium]
MGNIVKTDCRHFLGDRPCRYHKKEGVKCSDCKYYDPIKTRILIIKLGAMGDVLRTTPTLKALKEKYKGCRITWVVDEESKELLMNNSYLDGILPYGPEALSHLLVEEFDLVINLDSLPRSACLASLTKGKKKLGFGLHKRGSVFPFNKEAEEWFRMGIDDDLKKRNRKTYQEIIFEIAGLKFKKEEPAVSLREEELNFANQFVKKYDLEGKKIIGLATGAGGRWELKKWTIEGYLKLIERIDKEIKNAKILLFGEREEVERNREIMERSRTPLINTGHRNTLREFLSLLNLCDLVVTGDTLALHATVALKKKIVVLFGPTSSSEIELYVRGEKIVPDMDCLCCYKETCDKHPNCMENISPGIVFQAVKKLL